VADATAAGVTTGATVAIVGIVGGDVSTGATAAAATDITEGTTAGMYRSGVRNSFPKC
jgi:hypothetical protein